MLSVQQQNNSNNQYLPSMNTMMPTHLQQQENQYDRSTINSQQGLADKIQAVRHLWESENHPINSSQFIQQIDPNIYNPAAQNILHYN
jgi:hypothetical protein